MVVYVLVALSYFALFFFPSFYSYGLWAFFLLFLCALIFKKHSTYILIFAFIYLVASQSLRDSELSLGFEKENIRGLIGDVISVGAPRGNRRYGYRLKLLGAIDEDGAIASAKGNVYIVSKLTDVRLGDRVEVYGTYFDNIFLASSTDYIYRSNPIRAKTSFLLSRNLEGREGELASLLLLGVGSSGSSDISERARKAGLSHTIALSGMHLTILSSLFIKLMFFIRDRRVKRAISYVPLFVFVYISGWRASLLRAFIFRASMEFTDDDIAFFLSDVVLLMLFPYHVDDLGLIYSFLALSGILIISPYLSHLLRAISLPKMLSDSIAATLGALTLSIPVTYKLFGCYQLSSILTSYPASILIMLYMYLSLAAVFIKHIDILMGYLHIAIVKLFDLGSLVPEIDFIYPYLIMLIIVSAVTVFSFVCFREIRR